MIKKLPIFLQIKFINHFQVIHKIQLQGVRPVSHSARFIGSGRLTSIKYSGTYAQIQLYGVRPVLHSARLLVQVG